MRMIAIIVLSLFVWSEAEAQSNPPYAWCAEYTGGRGGATNCGFVTLEQCQWTVSGIGGFCTRNLFYNGPAQGAPTRVKSATKRQ